VVSHDRYFLDRLVDRIFEVREGELRVYEGGYTYYAERVAGEREVAGTGTKA
jgi:ATP-binding cassette, subfamily F, member 3